MASPRRRSTISTSRSTADVAEAAFLAALPKAPNNYNPAALSRGRAGRGATGSSTAWSMTASSPRARRTRPRREPIALRQRDATEIVQCALFHRGGAARAGGALWREGALSRAGLSVRTSLDPALQAIADQALRDALIAYDRRHGYRGPVHAHRRRAATGARRSPRCRCRPGADDVGWQLAVVLARRADGARDRLCRRHARAHSRWPSCAGRAGSCPTAVSVRCRPAPAAALQPAMSCWSSSPPAPGAKGAGALSRCARFRTSPAASWCSIRIPAASSPRPAASAMPSASSTAPPRRVRQTGSAIKPLRLSRRARSRLHAVDAGARRAARRRSGAGPAEMEPDQLRAQILWAGAAARRARGIAQPRHRARRHQPSASIRSAQYLKRFGITDHVPHEYAMLIGAEETTLLRLTTAYAMLDNGGKRITPTFIDRVQDRNGTTIYRADERAVRGLRRRRLDRPGRRPSFPTRASRSPIRAAPIRSCRCWRAWCSAAPAAASPRSAGRSPARPARPTNSNDTWFVGFSPDLVVRRVRRLRPAARASASARPAPRSRRRSSRSSWATALQGQAADPVPHPAGHRDGARRRRRPGSSPAPATATSIYEAVQARHRARRRAGERRRRRRWRATPPRWRRPRGDGRRCRRPPRRTGRTAAPRRPCRDRAADRSRDRHRRPILSPAPNWRGVGACAPRSRRSPSEIRRSLALLRRHL